MDPPPVYHGFEWVARQWIKPRRAAISQPSSVPSPNQPGQTPRLKSLDDYKPRVISLKPMRSPSKIVKTEQEIAIGDYDLSLDELVPGDIAESEETLKKSVSSGGKFISSITSPTILVSSEPRIPVAIAVAVLASAVCDRTNQMVIENREWLQALRDASANLKLQAREKSPREVQYDDESELELLLWRACIADYLVSDVIKRMEAAGDFTHFGDVRRGTLRESSKTAEEAYQQHIGELQSHMADSGHRLRLYHQLLRELRDAAWVADKVARQSNSEENKLLAGFYLGLSYLLDGEFEEARGRISSFASSDRVSASHTEKELASMIMSTGVEEYGLQRTPSFLRDKHGGSNNWTISKGHDVSSTEIRDMQTEAQPRPNDIPVEKKESPVEYNLLRPQPARSKGKDRAWSAPPAISAPYDSDMQETLMQIQSMGEDVEDRGDNLIITPEKPVTEDERP